MKNLTKNISLFLLVLTAMNTHAQDNWNAAGVWTGKLYNDSTKKFIPFEIAISYHNGKYSGYTYTVFVIDSVENIGVKEVTIKEKNNQWIIKDKKLIDDNYREAPAKGVYTTLGLLRTENDTADILSGRWFTNKTKEFYPLTGTVTVTKRKNIFATRIVPKLRKLGLANDLSFFRYSANADPVVKSENKTVANDNSNDSMMTIVEPELVISFPKKKEIKLPDADALKNVVDAVVPAKKEPEKTDVQKEEIKAVEKNTGITTQVKKEEAKEPTAIKKNTDTKTKPDKIIQENTLPKDTAIKSAIVHTQDAVQLNSSKPLPQQFPVQKIDLSNRKIETIRTVPVTGDSLVLSLFDNGAVDGDTVSVLLNGKVVVSKIGLLEKAFNQTIHFTPEMGDTIKIVLYAENLGSIPPNTGLLVVRNAGSDYEIRFSGDLTKNSAIILLRNKKE